MIRTSPLTHDAGKSHLTSLSCINHKTVSTNVNGGVSGLLGGKRHDNLETPLYCLRSYIICQTLRAS